MRYVFDDGPAGATFHFNLDAGERLPVKLQFTDGVLVVEGADLHDQGTYPILTAGVAGGVAMARRCPWLPLLGVSVSDLREGAFEQECQGFLEVDERFLASLASAVQARYLGTPFHWPFTDIARPEVVGAYEGAGIRVPAADQTPERWCYPPTAPSGIDVSQPPTLDASEEGIRITVPGSPLDDGPDVAAMLLFTAEDGTPLLYASAWLDPTPNGWEGTVEADCDPADVSLEIVDPAIGYGADTETRKKSWAALRQFATGAPSVARTAGSLDEPYGMVAPSFGRLILDRVQASGPEEAFRLPDGADGWRSISWDQMFAEASTLAAGLVALGVHPEDRVAIASNTGLEWILAEFAIMLSGGATTPLDPITQLKDIDFILNDSASVILIAENQSEAERVSHEAVPSLRHTILIDGAGDGEAVLSWAQVTDKGKALLAENPDLIRERVAATGPHDLATLIYTTSTTGDLKGAELTHGNWTYQVAAISALGLFTSSDTHYLSLPMADSYGKVLIGAQLASGGVTVVDGRIPKVVSNLPIIRPTITAVAPRILTKIRAVITAAALADGGSKASIFEWAFRVGEQVYLKQAAGEEVGGLLQMQVGMADRLVFSRIRERLGGRLRYLLTVGSEPLGDDTRRWFQIVGLPIIEGYGLPETTMAITLSRLDSRSVGSADPPLPGTEIRIADDGEVWVRGPGVMRGYHNREDANQEVFGDQPPGETRWFATGDRGVIDEGRVRITRHIGAPDPIEAQLKALSPLAGACVLMSNDRGDTSALIVLDPVKARVWAAANGKSGATIEQLAQDPAVRASVQQSIDQFNADADIRGIITTFRVVTESQISGGDQVTLSRRVKQTSIQHDDRVRDARRKLASFSHRDDQLTSEAKQQ